MGVKMSINTVVLTVRGTVWDVNFTVKRVNLHGAVIARLATLD